MNEKKWRRFFKNEFDKEMQEIDSILDEMNSNPEMKDVVAPEEMHDKLWAQINEDKEKEERLSDEEKELIRLGKVYKKRRKGGKFLVLIAAVVCALAIGVTSMGGPDKVIQKVQGMLEGREQLNNDSDDGRTKEIITVSEVEAYQQIEDEYGFYPVSLDYLPEGMQFEDISLADGAQYVYMCYGGRNEELIAYFIYPNYRTSSFGQDVEDTLIHEYEKVVQDNTISIKKYSIDGSEANRFMVSYEYQNVYYLLEINNVVDSEVEKIVENLFFAQK